ncbi:hypothetical protein D3C71_2014650 [compost metagenome]
MARFPMMLITSAIVISVMIREMKCRRSLEYRSPKRIIATAWSADGHGPLDVDFGVVVC